MKGNSVNWKRDLKLSDLEPAARLEAVCRRCGDSRYETAGGLLARPGFRHYYFDEAEAALSCRNRFCKGRIRLARIYDSFVEGFTGGMA